MAKPWNVEYANQAKAEIEQCMFEAPVNLPNFLTKVNLYIALLGSYGVVLGMKWLWRHRAKVDCFTKEIECLDDLGNKVFLKGIQREVKLRQISAMQLKRVE